MASSRRLEEGRVFFPFTYKGVNYISTRATSNTNRPHHLSGRSERLPVRHDADPDIRSIRFSA